MSDLIDRAALRKAVLKLTKERGFISGVYYVALDDGDDSILALIDGAAAVKPPRSRRSSGFSPMVDGIDYDSSEQ